MANAQHLEILKQGTATWNKWRKANPSVVPDLRSADLEKADLVSINFDGVDLRNAILRHAELGGAKLRSARLHDANLNLADLAHANLSDAQLVSANLTATNFNWADLSRADLAIAKINTASFGMTNLTQARFGYTVINDVDLSSALGLESAFHYSPSSIGIDTLYRSKGKIPEVFLRGCGVPDGFITQAKALIGAEEGIQFYSCFISYNSKDEAFATRLHARLQQDHVRVWYAPHDIQGGKKLHEQIDDAIKLHDKLLIILSPNSLKSEWVMTELRKARKAERKTGQRKLFPVGLVDYETLREWECFDADGGQDLAMEVRQFYIPDFTLWKNHDVFEKEYTRLLRDLRAEAKTIP